MKHETLLNIFALIIALFVLATFTMLASNSEKFQKKTIECLEPIAVKYCNEKGYVFNKIPSVFSATFTCFDNRELKEFHYTDEEFNRCIE